MHKTTAIILAILVLIFGCRNSNSYTGINIGAIASLTGPAGEQGRNWLNGALLAQDKLIAEGTDVRIIVEDDNTNPAKAALAFHKLATTSKVQAIIGGTWDYLAEPCYPLAEQYRIPFLTPTNPVELISKDAKKNDWIFASGLSIASEKAAIKDFLIKEKILTVALIYPEIPWGRYHAAIFEDLLAELNLKIIYNDPFLLEGYPDSLKLSVLRLSKNLPDLVYSPIDYSGIDRLTLEFERLKINPKLLVSQHLDKAFEFSKSPNRYRSAFGVYPKLINKEFIDQFTKKYGSPPPVYSAEGYDAILFLVNGITKGVKFEDPNTIFTMDGVMGRYSIPTSDRSIVRSEALIKTTKEGRFEEY